MNRHSFLATLAALSITSFAASQRADSIDSQKPPAGRPVADLTRRIEAANGFGIELYRQLRREGENVFLSPYSISAAFALCWAACEGDREDS